MVRQHDQGNLFFKMFNLGLQFQRVRVHDVRAKAQLRAHILLYKRKAETQRDMQTDKDEIMKETQTERARWKWLKSLKLQSTPPVTTFPNEATPPNPSQTVLPTGDQVFKHMSLWRAFYSLLFTGYGHVTVKALRVSDSLQTVLKVQCLF